MPPVLERTTIVREQHAFALNRLGRRREAAEKLEKLIRDRGRNSETLGLLGRVHKDRWTDAVELGNDIEAAAHLKKAIDTYLDGFEADWRDAFPGINALTLMHLADPPDPRRHEIGPVVEYSAKQRAESSRADYWDHATVLEAALLNDDEHEAVGALGRALAAEHEPWQPKSTLKNVRLITGAAAAQGAHTAWHDTIETGLAQAASR